MLSSTITPHRIQPVRNDAFYNMQEMSISSVEQFVDDTLENYYANGIMCDLVDVINSKDVYIRYNQYHQDQGFNGKILPVKKFQRDVNEYSKKFKFIIPKINGIRQSNYVLVRNQGEQ